MSKAVSPYRSLSSDRRVTLVTHLIRSSREARELYVQRLSSKTGFRPVTLKTWPVDKLAKEVVRVNAQTAQDEFDLMHLLYVELEPAIQIAFLDEAGVKHEGGQMPDDLEAPYTDEAGVQRGAAAVRVKFGDEGERYLQTLAKYNREGWPGIEAVLGAELTP
jgi:hypothetical protein